MLECWGPRERGFTMRRHDLWFAKVIASKVSSNLGTSDRQRLGSGCLASPCGRKLHKQRALEVERIPIAKQELLSLKKLALKAS